MLLFLCLCRCLFRFRVLGALTWPFLGWLGAVPCRPSRSPRFGSSASLSPFLPPSLFLLSLSVRPSVSLFESILTHGLCFFALVDERAASPLCSRDLGSCCYVVALHSLPIPFRPHSLLGAGERHSRRLQSRNHSFLAILAAASSSIHRDTFQASCNPLRQLALAHSFLHSATFIHICHPVAPEQSIGSSVSIHSFLYSLPRQPTLDKRAACPWCISIAPVLYVSLLSVRPS